MKAGKRRTGSGQTAVPRLEDKELWDHATRDLEPLRAKPRVGAVATSRVRLETPPAHGQAGHEIPPAESGARPGRRPKTRAHPPAQAAASPPPAAELDRRTARKLASGRRAIDARIDLHGMRQAEAHVALRSFLLGCYAAGLSFVLVITGKGSSSRSEDDPAAGYGARERGVLKTSVPRWLAEPDLSAIIVTRKPASKQHGGDGALYVQLRRRRIT